MAGKRKYSLIELVLTAIVVVLVVLVVYLLLKPEPVSVIQAAPTAQPALQSPPTQEAQPVEPVPLMPVFSGSNPDEGGEVPAGVPASADLPRLRTPFETPVVCEDSFNQESSWLICEPGAILDATATFTIPGTREPWEINVPEGGFTYFSLGHGVITIDGVSLVLPGEQGLNYLVAIRGRIDDTIMDSDLNETAVVTDFKAGHAIWGIMPPGAYVSHDWFREQLVTSSTTGGTNCGATGCSRVRIVLFDVDSHLYQMFETRTGEIDTWSLLEAN
jgi:hypothetical protein